jgi:hypothetical protein
MENQQGNNPQRLNTKINNIYKSNIKKSIKKYKYKFYKR